MPREEYLLSVISGARRGPAADLLRGALTPLAWLYSAGLKVYLWPYRAGLRRLHRLPCPVLSIGNLTVGGTGKTPMTQRVCEFLKERGLRRKLIAKIESRQGVRNLARILRECDGIMVARGDLGVSVPISRVPVLQKTIIAQCRGAGRFVITATQMLESMTEHTRPTRAEVSDVANAVIDGSNYVMLSGETAVGKHPVEAVTMMSEIVRYTEAYLSRRSKS